MNRCRTHFQGLIHTSVIITDNTGSPLGRGEFEGVSGSGGRSDRHTESEDKPSTQEVGIALGSSLDGSSDHDQNRSSHHAHSTAKVVADGTGE